MAGRGHCTARAVRSGTGVAREPDEPGSPVGGVARDGMRRGGSRRAARPCSRKCREAGRWLRLQPDRRVYGLRPSRAVFCRSRRSAGFAGTLLLGQQQGDPPLVATQRAGVRRTRPARLLRLRAGRWRRCFLLRCVPSRRRRVLRRPPNLRNHRLLSYGGLKHGGLKNGGLGGGRPRGGGPRCGGSRCAGLRHGGLSQKGGRGLHQSPRTFARSALPSSLHLPRTGRPGVNQYPDSYLM
jgi:hypothetical protein